MFSNGISGFFGKIKTALRARYLRRKVFCWLLVYCHLLLAFSGLANLFLPGLDDVAAAVGVTEALQGDFVRQARGLAGLVLEKRAQEKHDLEKHDLEQPSKDEAQGISSAFPEDVLSSLPEISSLAGLILLGRVSGSIVPIMFALTLLGLFAPIFFRVALWLGLAQLLFALVLISKAAYALLLAPELYVRVLSRSLQNFAHFGFILWLAALLLPGLALFFARRVWPNRRSG